jgi:hypothetical protein
LLVGWYWGQKLFGLNDWKVIERLWFTEWDVVVVVVVVVVDIDENNYKNNNNNNNNCVE